MHDYHFFASEEDITEDLILLKDKEFTHCCRVLRYKSGDKISIFDGNGRIYETEIATVGKNEARCKILNLQQKNRENSLQIHLAVGLVKSKALDLIVEQACSLGISTFYPVETEHSVKKNFNHDRYVKKALESIKQSGQWFLPEIHDVMSFGHWLQRAEKLPKKLIGYQHSQNYLNKIDFTGTTELGVFIGPEGGFSEDEIHIAESRGFHTVNLFDGRLRTELAVTTALAGINTLTRR
jgi:16S rRNA (uracil1498-N3)-methyltransferase